MEHEAESVYGIEAVIRPLKSFLDNKLAGAGLLMVATVLALVAANTSLKDAYHHLLHLEVEVGIGDYILKKSAVHWLNDGLMGLFFFMVGLEIKREMLIGDLSSVRQAALPIAAALGGMVVPALFFYALNRGGPGENGWGIPMATDIAFALGVLALLGNRVPPALTLFLTALAIVDDIGGILVIAVFYTASISLTSVAVGAAMVALSILGNRLSIRNPIFYFMCGAVSWLAFLESGMHATLAAVLMAFTIPARSRINRERFVTRMLLLVDQFQHAGGGSDRGLLGHEEEHAIESMNQTIDQAAAPLQRLEAAHAPFVTFLILPLFALGNAGVSLGEGVGDMIADPVSLGIIAGLVVGKQIGITSFAWLAVKLRVADMPRGVTWRALHAVSILGGIGFTMSLFIGGLAFTDPQLGQVVKVGILCASILSGLIGSAMLMTLPRTSRSVTEA